MQLNHLTGQKVDSASGRQYQTKLGSFPSVTTILNKTKSKQDQAILANWRKSKTPEERQYPLDRGNYTHKRIEHQLLNQHYSDPINPSFEPYYQPFVEFLKRIDKVLLVESHIYHPVHRYAGTVDNVSIVGGLLTLCDWKTAEKPKIDKYLVDYKLQIGAYSLALEAIYGYQIEQAYIVIGLPNTLQEIHIDSWDLELYQAQWLERLKVYHQRYSK